ncbi:MAG: flagellar hook-basal body complex protein [Hungatella sp.]
MLKSMYSAVAGLKAHQSKMDVIGNNIANVNTWGYKSADTSFKESMYQTLLGGSAGTSVDGGYGGTNPSMIGYGSMVSAITSNFTAGTQVSTGKPLDCFIDGTAFFAVGPLYGTGDAKTPGDISLSRVGDFQVVNGYLVDSNGRYVYGNSVTNGGEVHKPGAVTTKTSLPNQIIPNKPTNTNYPVDVTGITGTDGVGKNVVYTDAASPNNGKMTVTTTTQTLETLITPLPGTVDDGKGTVTSYRNTTPASANMVKVVVKTEQNKPIPLPNPPEPTTDAAGIITSITYKDTGDGKMEIVTSKTTPAPKDASYTGPTFDDGRMVLDAKTGAYKMKDNLDTLKPLKIPTNCTYYDESGNLQTEKDVVIGAYTIDKNGMIYGTSLKTDKQYLLGSVALVNMPNPNGMTKLGGPYYQTGGSSGAPSIIQAGGNAGTLLTGQLESANVDIANEFSSMITTERGFQANSKIITVSDEMLQELVNMKR